MVIRTFWPDFSLNLHPCLLGLRVTEERQLCAISYNFRAIDQTVDPFPRCHMLSPCDRQDRRSFSAMPHVEFATVDHRFLGVSDIASASSLTLLFISLPSHHSWNVRIDHYHAVQIHRDFLCQVHTIWSCHYQCRLPRCSSGRSNSLLS